MMIMFVSVTTVLYFVPYGNITVFACSKHLDLTRYSYSLHTWLVVTTELKTDSFQHVNCYSNVIPLKENTTF